MLRVVKRTSAALLFAASLFHPSPASANLRHSEAPFVEVFDRDKTGTTWEQKKEAGSQVIDFQQLANLRSREAEGTGLSKEGFVTCSFNALSSNKCLC
jgi:hypothetical protein